MVERATGLRTHVLNDVVGYAAYDRWFYPSPDERCRAVLLISQGIGAKLIINGDVRMRMPMEIGNFTLHENGAECECGKRGCLEATASTRAIVERVQEVSGQAVDDIECAVALAEPNETCSDHGDRGVPHRGTRPRPRDRDRAGDRQPDVVGDLRPRVPRHEEHPRR